MRQEFENQVEEYRKLTNGEIRAKRTELLSLLSDCEKAEETYREAKKALDSIRKAGEQEYERLKAAFDADIRKLQSEIGDLEEDIARRQEIIAGEEETSRQKYESALDSLRLYGKALEEKLAQSKKDRQSETDAVKANLEERAKKAAEEKEEALASQKILNDDAFTAITLSYDKERGSLREEEEKLLRKAEEADKEFAARYEEALRQKEEAEKELQTFTDDCNERIASFNTQIAEKKERQRVSYENEKRELEKVLFDLENDFHLQKEALEGEIRDARNRLNDIERRIAVSNEELEDVRRDASERRQRLENENESLLKELSDKKEEAYEEIRKAEEALANAKEKLAEDLRDLEEEKEKKDAEYREALEKMSADQEGEFLRIRQLHEETLRNIEEDYLQRSAALLSGHERQKNELAELFAKEKEENRKKQEDLAEGMKQRAGEMEAKILSLGEEEAVLLRSIEDAKNGFEEEKGRFALTAEALETEYEEGMKGLNASFEEKIAEARTLRLPKEELTSLREAFEKNKGILADLLHLSGMERERLDREEAEVRAEYDRTRQEAEEELARAREALDETKRRNGEEEDGLKAQYRESKEKLKAFTKEKERSLLEIRDKQKKEIDELERTLTLEHDKLAAEHLQEEEETKAQYEEEIRTLRIDLEGKQDELRRVSEELLSKKTLLEQEYRERADAEEVKVGKLRQDYESLSQDNADERVMLENYLRERKEAIERALEEKRQGQMQYLSDKRNAYEEELLRLSRECDDLRKEVDLADAQINEEKEKLAQYTDEKNEAMQSLKNEAERFVNDQKGRILKIAEKEAALQEKHRERVVALKSNIAESFSEFDELMRLKPQIISTTLDEGERELLAKADEFRKRIDVLEESHQAMMKELALRRDERMNEIRNEIAALLEGKEETISLSDRELEELSAAYDALLAGEKKKAEELKIELLRQHDVSQDLLREREDRLQKLQDEYEASMKKLDEEFAAEEKAADDAQDAEVSAGEKERDELQLQHSKLLDTLQGLLARYDEIDSGILLEKLHLKEFYMKETEEVDRLYRNVLEEQKAKLKDLDVMSEEANELFFSER